MIKLVINIFIDAFVSFSIIKKKKKNLQMEMELLDEDIRLWSAGKETNIRLLLSTLHHVYSII
jgi:hypothetical protein